jgi:hypothetical protein
MIYHVHHDRYHEELFVSSKDYDNVGLIVSDGIEDDEHVE